jgi:hypothetical protein
MEMEPEQVAKQETPPKKQNDSSADPISLAREIGQESVGHIGAKFFENIEISYICSYLKPLKEFPKFRLRQNLFPYWSKGLYKDLMWEMFRDYALPKNIAIADITSATVETAFGSITEDNKKIAPPAFLGCRFTVITELMAFLRPNDMRLQIALLNKVGEGNTVSRWILKFNNADESLILKEEDVEKGLFFYGNHLQYTPATTLIVCSHILDPQTMTFLNNNAFLDRFRLLQDSMSDEQAKTLWGEGILLKFDMEKLKLLRELNEKLQVDLPARETELPAKYKDLCKKIMDFADETAKKNEVGIIDVFGSRKGGNILREAIARHMVGNPREPDNFSFSEDIRPDTQIASSENFNGNTVNLRKQAYVKNRLEDMLKSGSMTAGDILKELQGEASTRTIYSVLHGYFESPKYGEWTRRAGSR